VVEATVAWRTVETWVGVVKAVAPAWSAIEEWSGVVETVPAIWRTVETWTGSAEAPTIWRTVESWFGFVGSLPAPPVLISPENNAVTDNTPTFQWTFEGYLENFRLEVDNDSDFSTPIENRLFDNTTISWTVPLQDSYPDDNYYWRVWAINRWGENVSENTWVFEVVAGLLPGKPVLVLPESDKNILPTTTFEWAIGANADNHRIEIDNDPDFSSPEENVVLGPLDNSYTTLLDYYTIYYWRVWAINPAGENVSENTWRFTVVARWNVMESWAGTLRAPNPPPVIISITSDSSLIDRDIDWAGSGADDTVRITIRVRDNNGVTTIDDSSGICFITIYDPTGAKVVDNLDISANFSQVDWFTGQWYYDFNPPGTAPLGEHDIYIEVYDDDGARDNDQANDLFTVDDLDSISISLSSVTPEIHDNLTVWGVVSRTYGGPVGSLDNVWILDSGEGELALGPSADNTYSGTYSLSVVGLKEVTVYVSNGALDGKNSENYFTGHWTVDTQAEWDNGAHENTYADNGQLTLILGWGENSRLVSGLPDIGDFSAPTIADFNGDGRFELISGEFHGGFRGFYWSGSTWVEDPGLVSGLPDIGSYSRLALADFNEDGRFELIAGEYYGGFRGFYWSGSTWVEDPSLVSGLSVAGWEPSPTIADFDEDGTHDLIVGFFQGEWPWQGFRGFRWIGGSWIENSGLISGLPNYWLNDKPRPAIADFNGDGRYELIYGTDGGTFSGYYWDADEWIWTENSALVAGLPDVGSHSHPSIADFTGDGVYELVSGNFDGAFDGFCWKFHPGRWTSPWRDFGSSVQADEIGIWVSIRPGENVSVKVEVSDNADSVKDDTGWIELVDGLNVADLPDLAYGRYLRVTFVLRTDNVNRAPRVHSFSLSVHVSKWQTVEVWSGIVRSVIPAWVLVESWSGAAKAPLAWRAVEWWTGILRAPDFGIAVSPTSGEVVQGDSISATVTLTSLVGYGLQVVLSAEGQPSGVSIEFSPASGIPPFTSIMTISTGLSAPPDTYTIIVTGTGADGIVHSTTYSLKIEEYVPPPIMAWYRTEAWTGVIRTPGFSIAVSPTSGEVVQGDSISATVTLTPLAGYGLQVVLSADGQPSGVEVTFDPENGVPSFESTMTITTGNLAPIGTYTITITGTGADGKTRSTTYSLTINAPPPDFSITVSPTSGEIGQGENTTATVTLTSLAGYNYTVSLTASGQPSGVVIEFDPESGVPTFESVMVITAAENAPAGTYAITITGTGADGKTRSTTYTLTIRMILPTSYVEPIEPYWRASVPFRITARAWDNDGTVEKVALWYRYSTDNLTWENWTLFGVDEENADGWSWSFTAPAGDGYYEFYSLATDNENNTEEAPDVADARCGVDTTPPPIPAIVFPPDGHLTTDATPSFDWSDISDPSGVTYELVIDNDADFDSPILEKRGIEKSSYTLSADEALPKDTYFWRVRAVDGAGNAGEFSEALWFALRVEIPTVLIGPAAAGENIVADFSEYRIFIVKVTITVARDVPADEARAFQITIEEFAGRPEYATIPPGIAYMYFGVVTTDLLPADIENTKIEFKIPRSWIEEKNVNWRTIRLLRWTGDGWENLETKFVRADADYRYFEAFAEGLSLFAAVGQVTPPRPLPIILPPILLLLLVSFILNLVFGTVLVYPRFVTWKRQRMLRRLKRVVIRPKPRRIGKPVAERPPEARRRVRRARLRTLKRLKRIVFRKKKTGE
jgi:PGF-pre-PGF domain-containing protein